MISSETNEKSLNNAYRALVESATEMIAILQKGRFCYANPATSATLGYSLEQLHQIDFLDIVVPDDRAAAAELCAPQLASQRLSNYEIGMIRKDGRLAILEIAPSLITYQGKPAVQLVGRDITKQKMRSEYLVQSEKLAALGRFISAVAHELNNPLTVIVGFAEILLSNLNLNEQDHADLQMIASEAKRARQMIHDLLKLARLQPQQKQPVDINQIISITLDQHRTQLQASHIQVATELALDLPPVSADPDQMKEVFTHLISYIRRSLTAGFDGGKLWIETVAKQVEARTGLSPVVEITFADNNPPRSPDHLRQIFEPSYSAREEDRGLGLAVAYKLVEQHGGQMHALSGPGQGTTFIIQLPQDSV
jgi:two-component system NtrC family sensor kinase